MVEELELIVSCATLMLLLPFRPLKLMVRNLSWIYQVSIL
jgi:hypothetical protein